MLTGTIDIVDKQLCVKYVTTFDSEPTQQTLWWKIERTERTPGAITSHPTLGDTVTKQLTAWTGPGYRAYVDGAAEAVKVERTPVPCPKAGKKQTRWSNGRWEKLCVRGWVVA